MNKTSAYQAWLDQVKQALASINMPMQDWQRQWVFDFQREFQLGTEANDAAMKANRFWWHEQNKALHQDCTLSADCWPPRGHQGRCQLVMQGSSAGSKMGKYKKGDHVKIEVEDKQFGASEWMWLLVEYSDDEQQLVFGQLDNEPIANTDMRLGQQLAVRYDKIREHKRFA
jgi:hypothetical protein